MQEKEETPKRGIAEPATSNVVYGPRLGFIEDIDTNFLMLTNKISEDKLKILELKVGSVTETRVMVVGVRGRVSKKVYDDIVKQIRNIEIDGIFDSYYISAYLQKRPDSIFKQVGITEKPDILAAKILEGRVAVLVDGSPICLTLPFILLEDLQASEDYYEEKNKASFMRLIRLLGVFLSIILPGVYAAIMLFHNKALPLKFLITVLNLSSNLPFPPALEILLVFLLFEILYEASIRVPKGLGSSFNIVGGLILGSALVQSNLASPITVMVVAVSGLSTFLIPEQANVIRLVRLFVIVAGVIMGGVGVVLTLMFLIGYLCDFDSYGAAYLAPYAPFNEEDQEDAILKEHITKIKKGGPKALGNKKR